MSTLIPTDEAIRTEWQRREEELQRQLSPFLAAGVTFEGPLAPDGRVFLLGPAGRLELSATGDDAAHLIVELTPPAPVQVVKIKKAKRKKQPSRADRWAEAVSACSKALDDVDNAVEALDSAAADLRSVQEEYEGWKDNMSDNLSSTPTYEKLEAVCELEIEDLASSVRESAEEARGVVDEAESTDLPLGWGKD